MIKRLIFVVLIALGATIASAEPLSLTDALQKIPALKQGVAYSLEDSKLNYLSTVDVMKWKGFNLEAGVAADAEETDWKAVAVLSYELLKLKKYVDLPILDLVEFRPGIYAGLGRIEGFQRGLEAEGDFGLSLSVISVKF